MNSRNAEGYTPLSIAMGVPLSSQLDRALALRLLAVGADPRLPCCIEGTAPRVQDCAFTRAICFLDVELAQACWLGVKEPLEPSVLNDILCR